MLLTIMTNRKRKQALSKGQKHPNSYELTASKTEFFKGKRNPCGESCDAFSVPVTSQVPEAYT